MDHYHAQITALQTRIGAAEAARDACSAAKKPARFLASCALVDDLAQQLWTLRLASLRSGAVGGGGAPSFPGSGLTEI